MDRIEELLREEFRRTTAPASTTRDAMLARVARARRRRRTAAGAGLTAVAVGATALAVTHGPGGRAEVAAPPGSVTLYSTELVRAIFTDHNHGYVVQRRCETTLPVDSGGSLAPANVGPTPAVDNVCRSHLVVTADAGRSWQERRLPTEPGKHEDHETDFGRSLMLWVDEPGRVAVGGVDRRYWTSSDGGTTWQESASLREVGAPGSVGVPGADDRPAFLATYPPGGRAAVGPKNPIAAATDGSFWSACVTGSCVAVTRNRGETWDALYAFASVDSVDWVATANGRTVYAAVVDRTVPRLLRSTDGGTTWTVAVELAGLDTAGDPISPERTALGLALPNGDVIMAQSGGGAVYRLKAGATTLERLTGAPAHTNALYRTGGWIVAASVWDQREYPETDPVVSLSPDNGTTWQTIPTP